MEKTYGASRRWTFGLLIGSLIASLIALVPNQAAHAAVATSDYGIVKVIPVGNDPSSIALNPTGTRAYVTNFESDNVSVIDTVTGTVVATIPVGDGPSDIAIRPGFTTAYVTNSLSNTITKIDLTTNTALGSFNAGAKPSAIAFLPTGQYGFVTNKDANTVSVMNPSLGVHGGVTADLISTGSQPSDIAINPAGTHAYVTNSNATGADEITVVDLTTYATTSINLIRSKPSSITINPTGTRALVGHSAAGAHAYTEVDLTIGLGQEVRATGVSPSGPIGLATSPDGNAFYALFPEGDFATFQTSNMAVNSALSVSVGSDVTALAITPSSPTSGLPIYVTRAGTADSVTVIAQMTASVTPTSGATGTTVSVDVAAAGIAYDIDDNAVTAVKFGAVAATPITPANGNSWTVSAPSGSGAVAVVVTFGWNQRALLVNRGDFDVSAGTFTFPGGGAAAGSPAIVPLWKAKLDPNGGTCVDGTSRSGAWTREFLGFSYIPGPTDCTRPGFNFAGWANTSTPTAVRNLPLLIDPSSDTRRYFVAENVDLIANWTPSPKTPTVFLGITDWICQGCGVIFFWDTPTSQSTPNITAGSGLPLCTKPENLFSLGDWTLCHERSATRGTYNMAIGSTRLTITIG